MFVSFHSVLSLSLPRVLFLFCFACSGEDGTLRGSSACHAATRVAIATVVGIPASMLVIQRRLYFMVRRSSSNETTAQVRSSRFAEWGDRPRLWFSGLTEKLIISLLCRLVIDTKKKTNLMETETPCACDRSFRWVRLTDLEHDPL